MDSYPQDLLVGVFPLVFAVNAIFDENIDDYDATGATTTSRTETSARARTRSLFDRFLDAMAASLINDMTDKDPLSATVTMSDSSGNQRTAHRAVSIFQPNEEDYSSDEEDIDSLFSGAPTSDSGGGGGGGPFRIKRGGGGTNASITAARHNADIVGPFGRRSGPLSNSNNRNYSETSTYDSSTYAYAHALSAQDFFAQARIESVSARHGFPPSKDPHGGLHNHDSNLALGLSRVLLHKNGRPNRSGGFDSHAHQQNVKRFLQHHANSLEGILPSGWLQKHVHALPSVILVVCTVCSSQKDQAAQDQHLFATIENLAYGLVPKRQCTIEVVGLMQNDVTMIQGDGWCRAVSQHVASQPVPETIIGKSSSDASLTSSSWKAPSSLPPIRVSLLRVSADLEGNNTGLPTSPALKRLHDDVRHASLLYYRCQARRTKDKLVQLLMHHQESASKRKGPPLHLQPHQQQHLDNIVANGPPSPLLPLVIRYCFKIALFYEFQGKRKKSLRYMAEGHRYAGRYYRYLVSLSAAAAADGPTTQVSPRSSNDDDENDDTSTSTYPTHSVADSNNSVEVALFDGNSNVQDFNEDDAKDESSSRWWRSVAPAPPVDMIFQCRAVADWLNLKLVSAGFSSQTEAGLVAAATQWREHLRVFCAIGQRDHSLMPDSSSAISSSQDWLKWSHIARQRVVMNELVERYMPSKILGTLIGSRSEVRDEVIHRCCPWRTAQSAVEALLRLASEIDKVPCGYTRIRQIERHQW